jgi:serine/threonine protein kinase
MAETQDPKQPPEEDPEKTGPISASIGAGDRSGRSPAPGDSPSAVESPRLPAGEVVGGRFRVVRLLGRGGMGEVYLAEDIRLDRRVALKVLAPALARDPQYRQRFHREARAASALSHPNVCMVHEVGEAADGSPFMAMEFIEGENLEARLRRAPLTILEIVEISLQTADALDAAHQKGIVHRDVKAANVCLDSSGRVKVLDFGLAKRLPMAEEGAGFLESSIQSTQTGAVLGTPSSMSPEQARGRPVDQRSDLFSLGVLLYQMITGRLPFLGSTVAEVIDGILHRQPEAMARFNYDLPAELDRLVRKCLEKSPQSRFQSAREVLIDLRSLRRSLERGGEDAASLDRDPDLQAGLISSAELPPPPGGPSPAAGEKEKDVLHTYASLDDQPAVSGRQGWISQFHRNLELRVAQLSGQRVGIWRQGDPTGGPAAAGLVSDSQLERVPEAKTCVSVVSPPFVRSADCRRVVEAFWRSAEGAGRLEVNQHSRILKVMKTPVEIAEIPVEIQPLFARLVPYEFFERDPQSGRVREFDEAFGELARQRFYERVYDVAFEISQVLKNFGAGPVAGAAGAPGGKRIFLAAATSDLEPERDQLRRELTELGHQVLPQRPLPLVAGEIAALVRGCLDRCDLAVHLVGEHYGLVPEATDLSVVALQNQVAAEESARTGLRRIIWIPQGLVPRDARQQAFLAEIESEPAVHRGAEVVIDTLENLKVLLSERWQKRIAAPEAAARGAENPPRVYLICDRQDLTAVEPLEDFFYQHRIEVSLPGFEAGESEVQEIHLQNLRDCDAALVYYGAGGMHWVDYTIRDLQKAAGYRDGAPIAVKAVYIAPPTNRRKERFRSVSVEVVTESGASFEPSALSKFAAAVKALKGGSS